MVTADKTDYLTGLSARARPEAEFPRGNGGGACLRFTAPLRFCGLHAGADRFSGCPSSFLPTVRVVLASARNNISSRLRSRESETWYTRKSAPAREDR